MNLISGSTQGSNEDEESKQKNLSEGELTGMQTRNDLAFTPETLDLPDIGASFTLTWIRVYHKEKQLLSAQMFTLWSQVLKKAIVIYSAN